MTDWPWEADYDAGYKAGRVDGYNDGRTDRLGPVVGYIVVTEQPDGSWKDDWDGEMHPTLEEAEDSFDGALSTCRVVECRWV